MKNTINLVASHVQFAFIILMDNTKACWKSGSHVLIVSSFCLVVLTILLETLVPFLFGRLVDGLQQQQVIGAPHMLASMAACYLLARFFNSLALIGRQHAVLLFERRFSLGLAQLYASRIMHLPRTYFDMPSGEVAWRLQKALDSASMAVISLLVNQLPVLFQVVAAAVLIASVAGAGLPLVMVLFALVFIGTVIWYFEAQAQSVRDINDGVARFYSDFTDSVSNIDAVKYFSAEKYFSDRLASLSLSIYGSEVKATLITSKIGLIQEIVIVGSWAAITILSSKYIIDGKFSIGTFVMVHTYFFMLVNPMRDSVMSFCMLLKQAEDLQFLRKIDAAVSPAGEQALLALTGEPETLEFNRVSFSYDGETPALRDLSFKARQGRILAIVGPSGGGKSTLAKLMFRLFDASSGEIRLNGQDISSIAMDDYRRRISIVPQDALMFADTIFNNLTLGSQYATEDLDRAIQASNFAPVLEKQPDGLDTVLLDRGRGLSGGELQRLSIARALLRRPGILVLDEATSALDAENERSIWGALRNHLSGAIVIVITHRMEIAAMADSVIVLKDGTVVEEGGHDDLIARGGAYATLFKS